MQGRMKYL